MDAADSSYESVAFTEAVVGVLTTTRIRPASSSGAPKPHARRSALVTFETAGIAFRYTYDGTTPTAAIGHLAQDGMTLPISGERNLARLKFILTVAGAATAKVTYHG